MKARVDMHHNNVSPDDLMFVEICDTMVKELKAHLDVAIRAQL